MPPGRDSKRRSSFTGIRPLQRLLGTHEVTEVSIRLRDDKFSPAADRALSQEMDTLEVFDWRQLDPQAAAFFAFADIGIVVWYVILLLALAFGLINSLITAVLERVREFGMLRALGMRPGSVVRTGGYRVGIDRNRCPCLRNFGRDSALVSFFSDGIDLSNYAAGAELAGLRGRLTPHLMATDIVSLSALALVLAIVASAYPAWRAVQIKPLDALRR